MNTDSLHSFFHPRSIAIVGASRDASSVGQAIFKNLIRGGFQGKLWPVNPKAKSILGKKAYPSLLSIPQPVDLALILVPAVIVPKVLEECAQKKISSCVIVSAGFKETGAKGLELEQQIQSIAQKNGLRLLGPNCLGLINPDAKVRLNASFATGLPLNGSIAFLSQSGALCTAILDHAKTQGIGFSKFVSLGNKADLNEIDLLKYLAKDSKTRVILMYLEDIKDGRSFIEVCREITGEIKDRKPILAIKSGRTQEGAKAISSHTGSLAGSDDVYEAILHQAGVVRVYSVSELFDYAKAFAYQPLPRSNRVAIITNAGGPGIMATDACVTQGLTLAKLSSKTVEKLKEKLPPAANFHNPIDVIGDARSDRYEWAIKNTLADENVDSAMVILTPQAMTDIEEIAKVTTRLAPQFEKPVMACFMGGEEIAKGAQWLGQHQIPQYPYPESAALALSKMTRYANWINRPRSGVTRFEIDEKKAKLILEEARKEKWNALPEARAHDLLAAYGFPVLKSHLAATEQEAVDAAKKIGFPVALKLASPDLIHKTEVRGIYLNVTQESDVRKIYQDLTSRIRREHPSARLWGMTVQEMAKAGFEMILGMKRDAQFGPVLMVGLGGVYVEALRDVAFRLAPIRKLGAQRIVEELKAYRILKGYRGKGPYDLAILEECIGRMSQLAIDCEQISELDINPLVVYEKGSGARAIDARIMLK